VNILQALADPKVFAGHFRGSTWDAWRVFLAALFALPMTPEQLAIYQRHTGRSVPPTTPALESWLCIGRRGGKSFAQITITVPTSPGPRKGRQSLKQARNVAMQASTTLARQRAARMVRKGLAEQSER
jgi:hypothetical protein